MFISGAKRGRFSPAFRFIAAFVGFCFLNEIILADILRLPSTLASAQVNLPPNLVLPSTSFLPATLKAIHINPQSPLDLDFIIDSADQTDFKQKDVNRLIQYFLAMLATPQKDLWVNLSPYEPNRIIVPQFGETTAGRDLLSQDNLLKQLAASLTYPESKIGKDFWDRVYKKASALYGPANVPVDTFARVWIVPQRAVVYEYQETAFVSESHLKVLLEEDYLALKNAHVGDEKTHSIQKVNNLSAAITREIILPEIEKEINEGKNFAPLRQVFNALILATWFKKKLRQHILSRGYVDQKKVKGIEDQSDQSSEKIYAQYLQRLKEGVYKYIREDFDEKSQDTVARQYFSGGFSSGNSDEWLNIRNISTMAISLREFFAGLGKKLVFAKVKLQPLIVGYKTTLAVQRTKNSWLRKKLSAGLLAGVLMGTSAGAGATLIEQNNQTIFQPPTAFEQITRAQQPDFQFLSSKKIMDTIKSQVTMEDVLKLNGRVNSLTKKAYKIDTSYFKRNWNSVITTSQVPWAQQVLVIAYQHKMGLQEDGQIGPKTMAVLEKTPMVLTDVLSENAVQPTINFTLPAARDLASGAPPPPDEENEKSFTAIDSGNSFQEPVGVAQNKSAGESLATYFHKLHEVLFESLLTVLIGIQTFRVVRDYKKGSSDRREFLKTFTEYLQGGKNHFLTRQRYALISKQASLDDISSKAVGNYVELIIRAGNALNGWGTKKHKQLTRQVIKEAVDAGDFRVMHGTHILKLVQVKRSSRRIHLIFNMPADERVNGKGISVYYRSAQGILRFFQMGLSEQTFEELEDFWEQNLKPGHALRDAQLADLVDRIAQYRQKNPLSFKDFRTQAVVVFKMRKLALATLRRMEDEESIDPRFKDYFYFIAQYANMARHLLAQCGTLDTFKSSFLPESDRLNFKILGLSLDKIYRVFTLVEHAYFRAQSNVKNALPDFNRYQNILDDIESQLQIEKTKGNKKERTLEILISEFDAFSMSFEKPYANSIVGLDLFRRHGKVLKSIKEILLLFSPLLLWLAFGSSLSMWIPWGAGFFVFVVRNYMAPKFADGWVLAEYQNFSAMIASFTPGNIPEKLMAAPSRRNMLLENMTKRFLPKARWSQSRFILAATQFSDVQAIRENSYAEIRFIADSHFMIDNGKKEELLIALRKAVFDRSLGFRITISGIGEDVAINRISVYIHPTGIRTRIRDVDPAAENVEISYHDQATNAHLSHALAITDDTFKQLINQWDHFMEDAQKGNWGGLDSLVAAIREFYDPNKMILSDFRKNAGFYHLIRDRAFATYEALTFDNTQQGSIYRQYFLELARYANEVRFLSASFAGMDALKFWYLPDGEFFNREIFGLPIARILRAIFGVSFLYSWVRTDTLESISRVAAQWGILNQIQSRTHYGIRSDENGRFAIERKLKTQFEKADFAFRYPAKNSLIGSDRYHRVFEMTVMLGFLITLGLTLGIMTLPFFISAINLFLTWFGVDTLLATSGFILFLNTPQLFGLSLVNFSIVFYMIAYWINPIHGNNAMERERIVYLKMIESYQKDLSYVEMKILQTKRILNRIGGEAFYYLSYVFGIFSPTVVMGYFLYQQVQSKFWKNGNDYANRNGYFKADEDPTFGNDVITENPSVANASSGLSAQNPGGIDLRVKNLVEIQGETDKSMPSLNLMTEGSLENIEGMDFQIIELTPILNPAVFWPNFVKGNAAQQFLSFKAP